MGKCSIVVHRNYAEGTDACAFWDEKDARKSVKEDVDTEVKSLIEEGYEPTTLWHNQNSVEVFVTDSDIYYEWEIIGSQIR